LSNLTFYFIFNFREKLFTLSNCDIIKITKYLETANKYDVLCFATPTFFMGESGLMRSLLERILFQYLDYDKVRSKYPGKTKVAYLATMGAPEEFIRGETISMDYTQNFLKTIFGNCESYFANTTLNCDNFAEYHMTMFDEEKKEVTQRTLANRSPESVRSWSEAC
jgi:multimeric flavodoxin WrbA